MSHIFTNSPLFSLPASIRTNFGRPLGTKKVEKHVRATVSDVADCKIAVEAKPVIVSKLVRALVLPSLSGTAPGLQMSIAMISNGVSHEMASKMDLDS